MPVSSRPKILYVDDEEVNRRAFSWILQSEGFEVSEAATGDEALRLAAERPDLVILDVNLPDINGFEVCRRLKSHPATTTIPILHISAIFVKAGDKKQGLEGGADGYLTKPVDPEEIVAHVRALLRIHEAEETARTIARQWHATFDALRDAVAVLDEHGTIIRCNRALAQLLDSDVSDLLNRDYRDVLQTALSPIEVDSLTRFVRADYREVREVHLAERWYLLTVDPVLDERGSTVGSVHLLADITAHKQAEQERLRLLQERAQLADHLKLLLESTGEGIYGTDTGGRCTFINNSGAALLGYPAEEILGQNMHTLTHSRHSEGSPYSEDQCPIQRAIQTGHECRVDHEVFWRRDGTTFPVEYSSYPIRRAGAIQGAVVTFLDITEHKRLEEQLRQALKMEALGRLAGGVAHDFNNLLAAITGNAALAIAEMAESDPHKEALSTIEKAAWRAAELVRQLLSFSRQSALRRRTVQINDCVTETMTLLARAIDPRIKVEVHTSADLWLVQGEPSQINQVLMNLCLNARDAMPEGGKLVISTQNVEVDQAMARRHVDARPGQFVRVQVEDSGHGIPPESLARIFEPFFTTKEPGRGTGLGLATVFGIVKQHQGWVECSSTVRQGTRFEFYLPRETQPNTPPLAAILPTVARGRQETILLVDDEPAVRDLGRSILRHYGYEVQVASDGLEAIEVYERLREKIDLVILDITMPQLSGRDAYRRIVQINPKVRVLFASGFFGDQPVAIGTEVLDTIDKPYRVHDLVNRVRAILDRDSNGVPPSSDKA